MRTRIFIAVCFLLVLVLRLIPFDISTDGDNRYYFYGLLPNLPLFAGCWVAILTASIVFTIYQLKQPLPGNFIIYQKDRSLSHQFQALAFWLSFILVSELLSSHHWYIFRGTSSYFFIILAIVLIYELFIRWYFRRYKPGKISIDKDTLFIRSLFKQGRRKLAQIKSVSYNIKQNAITLHFPEGLDNIRLYLTEFELTDLQQLIEAIKAGTDNAVQFDDNFNQYFPGKQNPAA